MMKTKQVKVRISILSLFMLLSIGCSNDDDTQPVAEPTDPPVANNEAPVVVAQTFTIKEDIADDIVIGTVTATDAEEDNLVFSLTQNNEDLFELTDKGELSLAAGKNLDFEQVTSHEITIEVSDGSNKTNAVITITVENVVEPFITTWKTTTADEVVTVQLDNVLTTYNFTIDWGDGTVENNQTTTVNHKYVTPGTYTVSIIGAFPTIRISNVVSSAPKLQSIEQWGEIKWESFVDAFSGCENLVYNAKDKPNLSKVTDMRNMFAGCVKFNAANLNDWDVSSIEDMGGVFGGTAFNGDISQWDVSKVETMRNMFDGATEFNGDISQWDVSSVTDMREMFLGATAFNGDISRWNVSSVINMNAMFLEARSFNGDISQWDVSNVNSMNRMFFEANAFEGDLSQWNVSKVINMFKMLDDTKISTMNYDKLLTAWAALPGLQSNVTLGAVGLIYCDASSARSSLINDKNWTISGDDSCPR
ncbi:BspA family leucine-rich repeat surface protein [Aquimarina algicola]|uniref:BspA family leucine-rich repeat surface protein n=1 Tax=Aquimarina algicola TaxID=2589995 RepID=A0A504JLI7_9FLAO|nr:BspA family leucine-rich repeat surface protein [Aquimarina algicola]TPN88658.1 BspA family leucine-rich repeat surface protein [Aquimarina algicola]